MNRRFEDFLFNETEPTTIIDLPIIPGNKIMKFSEYRKGSSEYGGIFHDLMMILRMKREEDKNADSILLTSDDLENFDSNKLFDLLNDPKKMRKLGMSFDVEIMDDGVRFYNLGNKESRPWENMQEGNNWKLTDYIKDLSKYRVGDRVKQFADCKEHDYIGTIENIIDDYDRGEYMVIRWDNGKIDEFDISDIIDFIVLSVNEKGEVVKYKFEKIFNVKIDPYGEENWGEIRFKEK